MFIDLYSINVSAKRIHANRNYGKKCSKYGCPLCNQISSNLLQQSVYKLKKKEKICDCYNFVWFCCLAAGDYATPTAASLCHFIVAMGILRRQSLLLFLSHYSTSHLARAMRKGLILLMVASLQSCGQNLSGVPHEACPIIKRWFCLHNERIHFCSLQ